MTSRTESSIADRSTPPPRRLPVGSELIGGGTHFRVWAPASTHVAVQFEQADSLPLTPEPEGYFSGFAPKIQGGARYRYKLDSGNYADPASRFQPEGPRGPSEVIDPSTFQWSDHDWPGSKIEEAAIYELHIGTFTPEGTWRAAAERLPDLAELGITVVEVMPVADFCGRFGWGYDGVNLFAPTHLYGRPDDFRAFVNTAHRIGLGVILDVVYNHLGPDGNDLALFSPDYFTKRHPNEWGEALNFDGAHNGPVREFFIANAIHWIKEFRLDGFRFDATSQMIDTSARHVLQEIGQAARAAASGRSTLLIAENEPQRTKLARPVKEGGYGLDALWNDDFHHAAHVRWSGHHEAYYSDYRGAPQEFISAIKRGYLFQGQWYSWQKQPRGTTCRDLSSAQFVTFLQNHDQVANSLRGERIHQLASPGMARALTALLLLGPNTPMLFQGQEFAASAPFLFFAGHTPELMRQVIQGREKFFQQFPSIRFDALGILADPGNEATFTRCKLDWSEKRAHAGIYQLHRDLLRLRKSDPVFSRRAAEGVDGAVLGADTFALRFFGTNEEDRLFLMNFGLDLDVTPRPEPLLAPIEGRSWRLLWSSENPVYGGGGAPPIERDGGWRLPAQSAVVLAAADLIPEKNITHGKPGPRNSHS